MNRSDDVPFTLTDAKAFCRVFIESFDVNNVSHKVDSGHLNDRVNLDRILGKFEDYRESALSKIESYELNKNPKEFNCEYLYVPNMTNCLVHLGYHLLATLMNGRYRMAGVPAKVLVYNFGCRKEIDVIRILNRSLSIQSNRIYAVTNIGECVVFRFFILSSRIVQLRIFIFSDVPIALINIVDDVMAEIIHSGGHHSIKGCIHYYDKVDVTEHFLKSLNFTKEGNDDPRDDRFVPKVLGSIFLVDTLIPQDYEDINSDEPPYKICIVKPFVIVSRATPNDSYDMYNILSWTTEPYREFVGSTSEADDKNKPIADNQPTTRQTCRVERNFYSISKHQSFNALAVFPDLISKLFLRVLDNDILLKDLRSGKKCIVQYIQLTDDICRYLESNQLLITSNTIENAYHCICMGGDDGKVDDFYKQVKQLTDLIILINKNDFDILSLRGGLKVATWRSQVTYRFAHKLKLEANHDAVDHQHIFRGLCENFADIKNQEYRNIPYVDYLKRERDVSSKHAKSLEGIRRYLQPEQDKTLWLTEILLYLQPKNGSSKVITTNTNNKNGHTKSSDTFYNTDFKFGTRLTQFINAISSRRLLGDQVTGRAKVIDSDKFQVTNFVRVNVKSEDFEFVRLYLFVDFKEGFVASNNQDVFIKINGLINNAFDKIFNNCNVNIFQSIKLKCLQANVSYDRWSKVELKKSRSKQGNFIDEFLTEIGMFQYLYDNHGNQFVKSYTRGQFENAPKKQTKVK